MTEHLEDRSFKRLTDAFPVPMLKYLNVRHDMTKPYKTTLEITNNNIYLTVALFMKSKLSKSELLLKIAELTNHVEGLSSEELRIMSLMLFHQKIVLMLKIRQFYQKRLEIHYY